MFNIGPSTGSGMPDWLKQKTGGNTGVTGGMRPRPMMGQSGMSRPQVMPRQRPTGDAPFGMGPMPMQGGQPPVSTTMPVGRPRPNIIPMPMENGIGTPGQQPLEENQLWRTYNRLLGGPTASRMLF